LTPIFSHCSFTTIFIGDELNAYKVFETLNARGVRLSSADLLKNYLNNKSLFISLYSGKSFQNSSSGLINAA
jgi:uncharacterized protein with ParB-like and HNH nuclease domain